MPTEEPELTHGHKVLGFVEILLREAKRSRKPWKTRGVRPRKGATKELRSLADKPALVNMWSVDRRSFVYALSVAGAITDKISEKEQNELRHFATALEVPDPQCERIDLALSEIDSTFARLDTVLQAYKDSLSQFAEHSLEAPARKLNLDLTDRDQATAMVVRLSKLFDLGLEDMVQSGSGERRSPQVDSVRLAAHESILELPMLDASEVSSLLGSRSKNPRQYAGLRRRQGDLIGLKHGNRYLYPKFQFDLNRKRPYPAIRRVGDVLDAKHDSWGVVSWWTAANQRLPGKEAPVELLATSGDGADLEALAKAWITDVG